MRGTLEDDEVRSLELSHELLGQQSGCHLPGGAAAGFAALVEAQPVGQRRSEFSLVDRQQGPGRRPHALGGHGGRIGRRWVMRIHAVTLDGQRERIKNEFVEACRPG